MSRSRLGILIGLLVIGEISVVGAVAASATFLMPALTAGELANKDPFWLLVGLLLAMRGVWAIRKV